MNHTLHFPEPEQGALSRSPMVYVKIDPKWEYKQIVRDLAAGPAPTAEELNALGADGWELAGILADSPRVYFYFKRSTG